VLLHRFGGALVLILSTVGTLCCVGGVAGIWVFHQTVSERVENVFTRLDVGLQRASVANQNLQRAVGRARADVAEVGKEAGDLGQGGEKGGRASRTVRTLLQQKVGPNVEELGGRLAALSDAAVVVSSLLESFQELPRSWVGRIEPGILEGWGEEVQQLSTRLRRLEAVVTGGDKEAGAQQLAATTSQVDLVLQRCQAKVDDWESNLDAAREEMGRVRPKIAGWLTLTAIAVTVLLVWVAAGQVSLFVHALRWSRGHSGGAPDASGAILGHRP
jgi:hypothetical protein